jgi:hypothetical protein
MLDYRSIARSELYDLIWHRPISQIAPELGISGTGLAKLCERHGIPVPERGHWAKMQHGKRVRRKPPLPPAKPGQCERIVIQRRAVKPPIEESGMPDELARLLATERMRTELIAVPKSPKPHPIVAAWPKPQKPSYGVADWSPVGEARRRRIASILFREIEKRGGRVSAKSGSHYSFSLFGQDVDVIFRERLNKLVIPGSPNAKSWSEQHDRTEFHPTGVLRLRFENCLDVPIRRDFTETADKPLETKLRTIIIAWLVAVEAERQRNERFAREAQERHERELRWLERQEAARKEREEQQRLLADAQAWANASLIRSYVAAIVEKQGESSADWSTWALRVADSMDPRSAATLQ